MGKLIGLADWFANSTVTEPQYQDILGTVPPVRKSLIPREEIIYTSVRQNLADTEVKYYSWSDMTDAVVSMRFEDSHDLPEVTSSTLPVPIIQKTFTIDERTFAQLRDGPGIDMATIFNSATRQIVEREQKMILDGWSRDGTTFEVQGFKNKTGINTESTAADFGTAGKAITKTGLMIAELITDNHLGPYEMYIEATQFKELFASHNATTDDLEMVRVQELLQAGSTTKKNRIHLTEYGVADGTCYITQQPDPRWGELIVAWDTTPEIIPDPANKRYKGRVYEAATVVIRDATAICAGSAI